MTANAIAPEVSRLHALAWRPGAEMHPDWWKRLDLGTWQNSYAHPACRASIDRLIIVRRDFPQTALPPRLDSRQSALLGLEPRLNALMIALGILAHGRPDYLITKPYRAPLAAHVGERGCSQLLTLCRDLPARGQDIAPDRLIDLARESGLHWWHKDADACIVTRLLTTVLPPPSPTSSMPLPSAPPANLQGRASDWLLKIGRFL
ncbi:type III secretion system domain-containing protein [Burkholderia ubonensis]|uniref:type III secretion system domain-containing protein n=1 Tax=Burkholderia ubonensis TaxID=101571 RepID=UPI0009B3CF81|nr:type III secretion system domain-containing protein [Burkholderia ubonensis]